MAKTSRVGSSVRTGKSVRPTPFRRGSERERVYLFLKKPKTHEQFVQFCRRRGVSATNMLRFLRQTLVISEANGKLWVH
jgi:hypothetical protein